MPITVNNDQQNKHKANFMLITVNNDQQRYMMKYTSSLKAKTKADPIDDPRNNLVMPTRANLLEHHQQALSAK